MMKGTQALVARLFAQHGGALRAFFYRRALSRPDAAELAQEVYARMLRISDADAIRNPEAYLYTVANNLMREYRVLAQRAAQRVSIDDEAWQERLAELPALSGEIDGERRIARLREVLRQLPPKCHAALVLQYWHEMSYEQIAQQLGVSPHTVKKYLTQALALCRRRMKRLR
jgi:RNA polymerase sigma factor (sigma-70 family)